MLLANLATACLLLLGKPQDEKVLIARYPSLNLVYGTHLRNLMKRNGLECSSDSNLFVEDVSVATRDESRARQVVKADSLGPFLLKPSGFRIAGDELVTLKNQPKLYPFSVFGHAGLIESEKRLDRLEVSSVEVCSGLYFKSASTLASCWLIVVRADNFYGKAIKIPFTWMFITDATGKRMCSYEAVGLE